MIFRDRIYVELLEAHDHYGTAEFTTVFVGYVAGIVTFLDSSATVDAASSKVRSRLHVFLSPFEQQIAPSSGPRLIMSWGPFASFTPDGAVEPHYLHGRLHHYELTASIV